MSTYPDFEILYNGKVLGSVNKESPDIYLVFPESLHWQKGDMIEFQVNNKSKFVGKAYFTEDYDEYDYVRVNGFVGQNNLYTIQVVLTKDVPNACERLLYMDFWYPSSEGPDVGTIVTMKIKTTGKI